VASFRLVPTRRFEDDFRELPTRVQGQVLKAIERIEADPHRGQKLVNVRVGQWRYRVGDYRIRYDIESQIIILHVVRHRKEVYRG
jgi:mRNA interferase RelE/StbE